MKRIFALLLCLSVILVGCGAQQEKKSEAQKLAYSQYALAEAKLPDIPEEPSEAEWDAFFTENDYDALGQGKYEKAYEEFDRDWTARCKAYREAMIALRGDDLVTDYVPSSALKDFTALTARKLFADAGDENLIYSPANLYLALSMLTAVTDGESREQVLALLRLESEEQAEQVSDVLWRKLYEENSTAQTLLANSVWLREGTEYRGETLAHLASDYRASAYSVPMGTAEADKALQGWINDNTGNLLEDAVDGLKTDPKTVLALVSALYFKDQWSDEFSESETDKDAFTAADGREQTVDFMHLTQDDAVVIRGKNYTIAQLSFRSGGSMVFLLPDEGTALSNVWGSDAISELLAGISYGSDIGTEAKVNWSVPKFDVDSDLELCDALKALGVTDVFDGDVSDFTPLGDFDAPIIVSEVRHAARVKVDEQGCEAAAYTAIMAAETAMSPQDLPEIDMDLNRPFAFTITGVNGLPLFFGVVNTME